MKGVQLLVSTLKDMTCWYVVATDIERRMMKLTRCEYHYHYHLPTHHNEEQDDDEFDSDHHGIEYRALLDPNH